MKIAVESALIHTVLNACNISIYRVTIPSLKYISAWYAGQATAVAKVDTGARLTCLGSFNPSAATSGKSSAAVKAGMHPDVKTQKPQRDSSEAPAVKGLSGGDKTAKAATGVVHDGVVDFPDANSAKKKKQKRPRVTANSKEQSVEVQAKGRLKAGRGRQIKGLTGIKVKPDKRK